MKKFNYFIAVLFAATAFTSCTDSSLAKFGALGDSAKIELVNCDGTVTHSWNSTGKVHSSSHSDGYYFKDAETGNLVEVSGNVIITIVSK